MNEFESAQSTDAHASEPASTVDAGSAGTPWHLWVVGAVSLLWNAVGAFDYLMTQTENASYMSNFTAEQLDFFYGLPGWVVFFWAIAVWGSVLGSILLLLKKGWAVEVFLVSLISMVITAVHNFFLANGLEIMGTGGAVFSLVIFIVAVLLWLYARRMRAAGVIG